MLSTIPQPTGTLRKTILAHWGDSRPPNPRMTESLFQRRISKHSKITLSISIPEKAPFQLTHFLLKQSIETPAPPGITKCKDLLTPSSKFSYSRVTGSHLKNPQQADCFCWCSTGLIWLFLKGFGVENRDVSLLWSQFLFSAELQPEF